MSRRPPTLLARTLTVTFATVVVVLAVVFIVLTVETHDRVRSTEIERLQVSERMFTALEARRQHDQIVAVATLAENPTLKAALDTYATEELFGGLDQGQGDALQRTVQREIEKLADATGSEVLSVLGPDGRVFVSAGPLASRWPAGALVDASPDDEPTVQDVVVLPSGAFRITAARLRLGDRGVGTLVMGNSLDAAYAKELADASHAGIVITVNGAVVASTVTGAVSRALSARPVADGIATLGGEEHAVRALLASGPVRIYTLTSIDAASRATTRRAMIELGSVAIGSLLFAGIASLWLARMVTSPIHRVAGSIATMTAARDVGMRLTPTGTSRELDALAGAFNDLLGGLAAAQAETQAAYLGTIRALAATLDARDEYTAGHSERVSEISVRIARQMRLDETAIEIIRFGALLHDIGKVGVSDEILRKPGPLTAEEREQIQRHPALGARILRQVAFLAPYLPIVELHHEQPDGRGYPFGLRGDDIPLAARIVHVADTLDAMTTARAYRPARSQAVAIAELQRHAGTQFDPASVDALVAVLDASRPTPIPLPAVHPTTADAAFNPALVAIGA
jgi:putative nucleotidyltransferase with HDIG domain